MTGSRLSTGVLASSLICGVLVAIPAVSAHADPTDCPTAFPTASAVDGVSGTGYTVERGTAADPFTATVLGRITDGIAPGIDMIMADLDSPALRRAGGVWAGMSGSPVYTADGRLIGSVSYGLAASSPIAGITPAEDLQKLLSVPAGAGARTTIRVNSRTADRIARTGDVTAEEADNGFVQLKVPVAVSGATKFSPKFLRDLTKKAGIRVHSGGARIPIKAAAAPTEITAGSNFAAALSYGDVSISGVGTTTFVCHGQAVAFGHPFLGLGDVEYSAHPATAVYIQPDPVGGPFKVANPGGPVGVVDRDKQTGIRTSLGASAKTFAVTTSLTPNGGAAVTGTTTGVYQPYAADIAALHLQANIIKALGADGGGSAGLTFTIKGVDGKGKAWSLTRSDHYADRDQISFAAADDLYTLASQIVSTEVDDPRITSINVTGSVDSKVKQYRVTGIKMYKGGKWVAQKGVISVKSGSTVSRQFILARYRSASTITRVLRVKIPTRTKSDVGVLTLSNGLNANFSPSEPKTFASLIKQLAAYPTNDSIAGSLSLEGAKKVNTVTTRRLDAPVSDFARELTVRVK